ncbi:transcriptional repressor NF-X1-like [Oculina patagonica]
MSEEGLATGLTSESSARDDEGQPNARRSHSAGGQRKFKGRGANRGNFNNKNQNDRQWSSTSGRRHPGARNEERAQHKVKNIHDEKGKDLITGNNEFDQETVQSVSEQGACYHDSTPSIAISEHRRTEATQIGGNYDHTGEKHAARSTATRQNTRAFKGQISKRNYPQGTRRMHGQSEGTRSSHDSRRDFMYAYSYDQEMPSDPAIQKRPTYKPINTGSRQKGPKGEAATAKVIKREYKSQKEDVLRTLSHLNPVQSSQASALIEQLRNETYECMVCCERVRCSAAVWNCYSCHHLFHLGCVRKWAKSSAATAATQGENGGWRCPGCQNINQGLPNVYKCFCGKVVDPEWRRHEGLTPHSCGELCGRQRDSLCQHRCNQLCHPGPCPSCPVMITKACSCGKTKNRVRCGQATTVLCEQVCNKVLNCFTHRCTRICHTDPCGFCQVTVKQTCYCGKQCREAICGTGEPGFVNMNGKSGYFSCQDKCLRVLDCGNHYCQEVCHGGACAECLLKPSLVSCCPCGKSLLFNLLGENDVRKSCLDPVPTCKSTCGKSLPCSPSKESNGHITNTEHRCKKECHLGDCGPCDGITKIKCRCGSNTKEIPCVERNIEEYSCEQRCNKKRQCGRHRCNQKCCVDTVHKCEFVCGKKLRCGYHKCLEPCHLGYCPPCLLSGFEELTCHCGSAVLYPPIPCGTLPPDCNKPCSRTHACSHSVNHSCHSEETCPPCTALTKKMCMGEHEVRHNIPCHVIDVSCGKNCGKQLSCGHKCAKICHKPPCLGDNEPCLQQCELARKECGHPCAALCHVGKECPPSPCKVRVTVKCKCGRRSENFPCLQGGEKVAVAQAYQRLATESLANKMKDLQSGQSVDISSIMNMDDKKSRELECNSDCAVYERNRRLAEALNIENADLSPETTIRFSPFLIAEAKQHLGFVKSVEETLENLVQTTVKMSASQRSHSFPPMNSNQRRLVHELAVFYNCSSRSYDQEPKRNTVVTATKESYLPSVKLSVQIEREINPPPPQPIPYLPSKQELPSKSSSDRRKGHAWAQIPDYFADDFQD